jgi:hypothetical protein
MCSAIHRSSIWFVVTGTKRPHDSSRQKNPSIASAVAPSSISSAIAIEAGDGPPGLRLTAADVAHRNGEHEAVTRRQPDAM